ncbi:hypothetical protein GCM10029964_001270 [Kibdelosporangium lantanae]
MQWADALCAAILDYDSNAPTFKPDASSPQAMVTALTTYLDATAVQIVGAKAKLTALGPAPVAGGDEANQALVLSLDTLNATVAAAKGKLSGVNVNDRTAVNAAIQEIAALLSGLRTPVNPLEGMGERFPDLQAAARSSDNCTEISRTRASRAALPPISSSSSYPPSTSGSTPPSSTSSTGPPTGFTEPSTSTP